MVESSVERSAKFFKTLSVSPRPEMVRAIASEGEMCVTDLQGRFRLPQFLLSHNLALLKGVGILQSSKRGRFVFYSINPDVSTVLDEVFLPLRDAL